MSHNKHHCNCSHCSARNENPSGFPENVKTPFNDERARFMMFPDGPFMNNVLYDPVPKTYEQPVPEEIAIMAAEGSEYIHPAVLALRECENTLPEDIKATAIWDRAADASMADVLAADMADLYRRHIATIMELNTQRRLMEAADNRKLLYHLVKSK